MKIIGHRLRSDDNTPFPFVRSPNAGGRVQQELLVLHYTAGRNAEQSVSWFANPQAKASAHVVVGRDGGVTQLVPFDRIAWHAGKSEWRGREGLNRYSLGIELDNAGRLTRHGERWRAWFGDEYDDEEVIEAVHKHETAAAGWHLFPPAQIEAALQVASALVNRYPVRDVVGHEDIAPGRKSDPGPAFPMTSFRARVLGRAESEPDLYETTAALNIRSGPGTENALLEGSPLPQGTRVEVLSEEGRWRRVDAVEEVNGVMDLEGWVHGRYLRPLT